VRRRVKQSEIGATLAEALGLVFQHAQRAGAALTGPPLARYIEWGPGLITIEAGMPIAASVPGDGDVAAETLPGGPVATTTHTGPYDKLTGAHAAIQLWIEQQGRVPAGAPWESYVTDPADYPDPKDWKTEIFWPIKP
jgi:AraC family transcriptional regulator